MTDYYINITKEELNNLDAVCFRLISEGTDKLCIVSSDEYTQLSNTLTRIENNTMDYIANQISNTIAQLTNGQYPLPYADESGGLSNGPDSDDKISFEDLAEFISKAETIPTLTDRTGVLEGKVVSATSSNEGLVYLDPEPTLNSNSAVQSGGVYNSLNLKQDKGGLEWRLMPGFKTYANNTYGYIRGYYNDFYCLIDVNLRNMTNPVGSTFNELYPTSNAERLNVVPEQFVPRYNITSFLLYPSVEFVITLDGRLKARNMKGSNGLTAVHGFALYPRIITRGSGNVDGYGFTVCGGARKDYELLNNLCIE